MTREKLLDLFSNLHVWKQRGVRAPHKPLLLLLALGRVANQEERLVPYTRIEGRMEKLLRRFGPLRQKHHPEFPFGRLPSDSLWVISGSETLSRTSSGDLLVSELRELGVKGGFPELVHELLFRHPALLQEAAQGLLDAHFPDTWHDEIRIATGIPFTWVVRETPQRRRDPAFRRRVLREYQYRCAVCNY
ncbi:MAG: hypothetical protein OXH11_06430, partial [Candidatus Aminicenantes bacterium]|nr:hypothetical protein [Candidatus Aminicenantes bacterium]